MRCHILSLITLLFFAQCESKKSASDSEQATEATNGKNEDYFLKTTDGNTLELSDLKGKRVFLNFWATWCKPCVAEMPAIEKAAKILEQEGYIFILASDQSMKKIKQFEQKKGFNLQFAKLNGSFQNLGIQAIPMTYIYDTKGEKQHSISGAIDWTSEKVLNKLRAIE